MYAVLSFDVEDVYFPPKYHIDDIPGWLAEIMTDCGVRGTFFVMGEKARSMRERGRRDVLEQMAEHSIGSHGRGNRHPLIPEILQEKGWDDGVEAMRRYEEEVTEEHLEAFGREPVALSRHNAYFAPQHVALAGEKGIPYAYGVTWIEGYDQPTWYAGALTFPEGDTEASIPTGLDTVYSRDEIFEERLREIDQALQDRIERGFEYVTIFGGHPVRVMTRGWQEHYCLASGMTRTPQELGWLYDVKSPEEGARAKANFRRFVEYLRDHPDVEIVGVEETTRLFSTQPSHIRRDVLTLYAEELKRAGKPIFHSTFSPAELACGFAESLIHAEEHADLPSRVQRRDVLGPKSRPALGIERDMVTHEQLIELCRQLVEHVSEEGALPANLHIEDRRVGIGQFALVAARCYLAQARYEKYERLRIQETPRYPGAAFELDAWIRRAIGEHWAMPLDFSCDRMAEHARLQTWTMKPAWLHPPQGPVPDGERIIL
ncbi:MAG: hypothetical protein U9Q78_01655 [Chloroflexota bacterium]|nr:hypothetical protein [Chloroflexota bacterium]